ncbi:double homeobox protein 4C-like [Moschus berezovskii]|uniref:double homeobox protein 4C-like n=1 Tax=Moschus berezovskii TaxID=68408 RepID=UPI002443F656|nr:double homeobox protein 4C-like [Moschus berezovskii]
MASSGSSSTSTGPIATGSRRRRLVLKVSQKDALQALFQHNPYPGIATRERLARELGIAESRVQVWFQNQRRRRLKQSRSPSANVQQDGKGATAHAHTTIRTFSTSVFLPRYGFKTEELVTPSGAQRGLATAGPKAQEAHRHNYSCSSGPKGPARCPEHLSSPSPLSSTGGHAALGCSRSFGRPHLLGAGTASGVCVGQPLMIFMVQPSPVALRPSGKPAPPPERAVPWAASSRAVTAPWQPGSRAILPPVQPEPHTSRWPESSYGEATAPPPLEPQPHAPNLPSSTSLLHELLPATGVPDTQAPSLRAASDAGGHPAMPGAPSFSDELWAPTGSPDTQAPSAGGLRMQERTLPSQAHPAS